MEENKGKKERKKEKRKKERKMKGKKEGRRGERSVISGRPAAGAAAHGASQTQARKGASLAYIGFLEFWKRDFGE